MKKIYFVTGTQDLYGDEVIEQVAKDSKEMVAFLNDAMKDLVEVEFVATVTKADVAKDALLKATGDANCVGVIAWMHTFSPAKMWISGLKLLKKPLLHLHTQANEKLPYDSIDMDFMNLNQSAHGDREFGFILKRMGIKHQIVSGYYRHDDVVQKIRQFAEVALAIDFSGSVKAATFGNNMRDVAVTDGDRVESQIQFGWETNYYGLGDLVDYVSKVQNAEVDEKMREYREKYVLNTTDTESVKEQAKYDVALHKFCKDNSVNAFTDTFQDLHGLKQLPGLAVQNMMAEGYGFGPEGDYKTACLGAVLMKLSEKRNGATGFIEDYTYDLSQGEELELGSHMLEVSPAFAADKPLIEVHPLSIGGKENPARLVFDGIEGKGVQVTLVDLGTHFRMIAMEIELVKAKPMPKLPVARIMWKILPSFAEGTEFWLENGGGHHAVISTAITVDDLKLFAKLMNLEFCYLTDK